MANAANTGSTLSFPGGQNKTSTSISTHMVIMVNNVPVGAIQNITINEKRAVKQIDEVGTDGHVDSVPVSSTNISGSCTRIRFDRLRILEAFGRGFIHVASQAYPFDIVILDKQKRDQGSQISTVIKNVWITGIDYQYQADNWLITDNMQWEAEQIFSVLNSGSSQPVANGGERQIPFSNIPIERQTDTGANGRRGSLDASGLIDLGDDGSIF
jgi:hypothetical protein